MGVDRQGRLSENGRLNIQASTRRGDKLDFETWFDQIIPRRSIPLTPIGTPGAEPEPVNFFARPSRFSPSIPSISCPGTDFTRSADCQGPAVFYSRNPAVDRWAGPQLHERSHQRQVCPMRNLHARKTCDEGTAGAESHTSPNSARSREHPRRGTRSRLASFPDPE